MVFLMSRDRTLSLHEVPAMTTQTENRKSILKRGALLAGTAILGIGLAAGIADSALMQNHNAIAQPIQLSGAQTALPSFADLVEKVKPAVVSVRVKAQVASAGDEQSLDDIPPQLRRFFRERGEGAMPNRPQPRQSMSQGSGFFVSQDGYVVTNNHVVENAVEVQLVTDSGKTLEASLHYTGEVLSGWLSSYLMESSNDIITFGGGALNAGKRAISGVDANLRWHLLRGTPYALQTWAYYSYIDAEEERFLNGDSTTLPVGDTAEHKFYLGLTWLPRADLSVTLRGRHIGSRTTVPTNPIREVPRYTSWDFNALWSDIMQSEFSLALTITNASDTVYYHPGLREADAGTTPGFFDGDGVWQGSNSFYNSLMPQDGRGYFLTLYLDW